MANTLPGAISLAHIEEQLAATGQTPYVFGRPGYSIADTFERHRQKMIAKGFTPAEADHVLQAAHDEFVGRIMR